MISSAEKLTTLRRMAICESHEMDYKEIFNHG